MSTYKVWVHIEEIDELTDHYEDLGIPEHMGEFHTEEEARARVTELLDEGEYILTRMERCDRLGTMLRMAIREFETLNINDLEACLTGCLKVLDQGRTI